MFGNRSRRSRARGGLEHFRSNHAAELRKNRGALVKPKFEQEIFCNVHIQRTGKGNFVETFSPARRLAEAARTRKRLASRFFAADPVRRRACGTGDRHVKSARLLNRFLLHRFIVYYMSLHTLFSKESRVASAAR